MKHLFSILLLSSSFAFAQNVEFEDADLKASILKTYPTLDANKDGEISLEEAQSATAIRITTNFSSPSRKFTSAKGIEAFVNIKELNLGRNAISSIDLSKNTKLETLNLRDNTLTGTLDLSQLPALKNVELNNNSITELLLHPDNNINTLYANDNLLTNIPTEYLPKIQRLFFVRNKVSTLSLATNTELVRLHITGNLIQSLDISNLTKLNWMSVSENQLKELTIKNNPALKSLLLNDNQLKELNFKDGTKNTITLINITNNPDFAKIFRDCDDTLPTNLPSSVEIIDCTLKVENFGKTIFEISPNPATDFIRVSSEKEASISIFDLAGKLIKQGNTQGKTFSVS
ncbi:MAG: hypothetical protein Q4C75_02525, partial [Bergeyella zoohelcum]|nr:hypothetical protein [Bergeyella zoohelcum]